MHSLSLLRHSCSVLLLGLLAGCASKSKAPAEVPSAEATEVAAGDAAPAPVVPAVEWSYEGATGPEHWGSLAPQFALCATGKSQSPIDIAGSTAADLTNCELHYAPTPVNIVNNGHAIQVNYAPGSYMQLDGVRYDLLQFHFHSPSEHTIDGKHAAAEMHLVHKSADGTLAVLGVLIEEGVGNRKFEPVWSHLPAQAGPAQTFDQTINVADLLPGDARTYRYMGSLTTPPGTEGVNWSLVVEPMTISKAQIEAFRAVMYGNNRPTQPLNGRVVQKDSSR